LTDNDNPFEELNDHNSNIYSFGFNNMNFLKLARGERLESRCTIHPLESSSFDNSITGSYQGDPRELMKRVIAESQIATQEVVENSGTSTWR